IIFLSCRWKSVRHLSEPRTWRTYMEPAQTPTEFMVLFRSTDWNKDLSLEEMQKVMDQTYAWFDSLRQQGKFKAAQPLFGEGKVLSATRKGTVTDGPFA